MKKILKISFLNLAFMLTQSTNAYGHGGDDEFIPSDINFVETEKGIDIFHYALYIIPGILFSLILVFVIFYKKNKNNDIIS